MSFSPGALLRDARQALGLTQGELAARAGVSRMTVQKLEAETIDARVSTIYVLFRAVGLELIVVPVPLKTAVDEFLRSGGRIVGQAPGVGAPPSIIDVLTRR